jgi:hypothetical protein
VSKKVGSGFGSVRAVSPGHKAAGREARRREEVEDIRGRIYSNG